MSDQSEQKVHVEEGKVGSITQTIHKDTNIGESDNTTIIEGDVNYIISYFGGTYKAIKGLLNNLKEIAAYYKRICEWKDVHSHLQQIQMSTPVFCHQVRQWCKQTNSVEADDLRKLWSPCGRHIEILVSVAEKIEYISEVPFRDDNGRLYGPRWIVSIYRHKIDIEAFFIGVLFDEKIENIKEIVTAQVELSTSLC